MSIDQIIFQVGADREQSEGYAQLDQRFFLQLHQAQLKYIKLKHGRKSKQSQRQLHSVIVTLVSGYTECIDYFGAFGDAAVAYFQIKIKEINKYFQFLNNQITPHQQIDAPITSQNEMKKDLGSISDQTGVQLLPEQQRSISVVGRQALNHNLMVSLQNQDIGSHIKENMKKHRKIRNAITDSLKQQDDFLMIRKSSRKGLSRSMAFRSFTQNTLDFSQFLQPSQSSQLMFTDLQALDANSPEQLKALALKLTQQINQGRRNDQNDGKI